uniref:protein-tyrosine-phosphatase n=1 Tax=Chrysemys picta bellii TaxID=8478 RepID=A0A8C3IE41_CHRPI
MAEQVWDLQCSLPGWEQGTDAGGLEECEVKDLGSPIAAVAPHPSGEMAPPCDLPFLPLLSVSKQISINRSRLYRSPSMPEKLDRPVLKRIVRCQDNETPVKVKLRPVLSQKGKLCGWELPLIVESFKCKLDPLQVAALLFGQFQSLIETFYIIDCRYPYEYWGGGALNFHRQEDVFEFLLKKPLFPSTPQKRIVLVFHCEFSSERGPKMCRYLRAEDRAMNEYPALHYPELYVLKGGYKEFFPEYRELCEPQDYCPMHHQDYKAELLKFRTKSKLWAGDRRRRDQIARLMKL